MKVAVTGSTGKLGNYAIEKLLDKTSAGNIIAVARNAEKAKRLAAKGVEVRQGDYENAASLEQAFAGVDRVLLISSSEVGKRASQHKNVIDAAKKAGVSHIVYTSITKAETSTNPLAPEHKETERYLKSSRLAFTIVRNNWYTENYIGYIEGAKAFGQVAAAAKTGRVASATREDYAEGAAAVLLGEGHNGKTYEFGGDHAFDYKELASTIGEIIGKDVPYVEISENAVAEMLKSSGMDEGTAGFYAMLDTSISEGTLEYGNGDLSKIIGRPTATLKSALSAYA